MKLFPACPNKNIHSLKVRIMIPCLVLFLILNGQVLSADEVNTIVLNAPDNMGKEIFWWDLLQ